MADTTADQVAAALAQIRERTERKFAHPSALPISNVDVRTLMESAGDVPRLLATLEAVQELADEWAAAGPSPRPAAEIERRARAAELREVIACKLLGEEGSRG